MSCLGERYMRSAPPRISVCGQGLLGDGKGGRVPGAVAQIGDRYGVTHAGGQHKVHDVEGAGDAFLRVADANGRQDIPLT